LNPRKPPIQLSESDIRAVYAAGEESVVGLVMQLIEQVNQLTLQVKALEDQQSKKTAVNPRQGMDLVNVPKACAQKVSALVGVKLTIRVRH
jgi:hypothetical protein